MTPFEGADPSFTARAPAQRGSRPSRARFMCPARQDDMSHATVLRRPLVGARRKGAISDGQVRRVAKEGDVADRKSTRLNSSHLGISYAVFCLKQKTNT